MFGKLSHAKVKPAAMGVPLNSSVYGTVINQFYGMTIGTLKQIWAANIRKGSSGKKGKKAGKKGAPPTYVENADFLIGANPILATLRYWANQNDEYPLDFAEHTISRVAFDSSSFTIPDAAFYCLIAVTFYDTYSITVNDYGGPGPVTLSGTSETPMWNLCQAGPDLSRNAADRSYPFIYKWQPGSGPTVEIPAVSLGALGGTFKFYYAKLRNGKVPTSQLRLTFEPRLGDGPEYSGFGSQQIIYPHIAGIGSPNLDLGVGAQPNIRAEVIGAYSLYPSGDCDYVDIIQDILKGGVTQAGFGTDQSYSTVQRGLNCYKMPGVVQQSQRGTIYGVNSIEMSLPVTKGNFIIVYHTGYFSSPTGCTDTAGTVYTEVFNQDLFPGGVTPKCACYIGQVPDNAADNVVTVAGAGGNDNQIAVFEIAGVDTLQGFDVSAQTGGTGSASGAITTDGIAGRQAYIFTLVAHDLHPFAFPPSSQTRWDRVMDGQYLKAFDRRIQHPGDFDISLDSVSNPTNTITAVFSFKNSQPVSYPKVFGDVLNRDWLDRVRLQCRAYGLYGSLNMDSQRKASEWLQDLCEAAVCAPVWSGSTLKLVPYCEVSGNGWGTLYIAPTASGPIADLTPDDMIADSSGQCITVEHTAPQVDDPNVLQIQHPNRGSDYNDVVTAEPVAATIALYGTRKESPKNNRCVQDTAIARKVLSVRARRQNLIRDNYKFTLKANRKLVECMDLYTISDPLIGLDKVPVRITSVEEDSKFALKCEAEPFYYGMHLPGDLPVTTQSAYKPSVNGTPNDVNTPIIFEPVPALSENQNQSELWLVVSDGDDSYGGCQVLVSVDGGVSYSPLGTITGNAVTGELAASWASHADPDTINDLLLDLSESNGDLEDLSVSEEDSFVNPCYVEGGTANIPYELIAYATAVLTGPHEYTLKATGTGNKLRRAVYNAPFIGGGPSHASGKRFASLDPAGAGILKVNLDPKWIGVTLYFKFLAFNTYGNGLQSASDVPAYAYTPTGTVGTYPGQLFLVDGYGPGEVGPTTLESQTANNTSAFGKYNKSNFPSNFTGVSVISVAGATIAVDSTKKDDSQNASTPRHVSDQPANKLLPSHLSTLLGPGVHDTDWFGSPGHIDIGVNCRDAAWVKAKIDDQIRRGLKWSAIYWGGPGSPTDESLLLSQAYIATLPPGTFKFIPMVDKSALKRGSLTSLIAYIQSHFLSDPNIVKIGGKPVIHFFDVQVSVGDAGMAAAKAATTGSSAFWMPNGTGHLGQAWVDGVYLWAHNYTDGLHVTNRYRQDLVASDIASCIASGKPYMPCLYHAFNGTETDNPDWSWGKNVPGDSGKCWVTVCATVDANADSNCVGPIIATWNDYEEGTEIETGIQNDIVVNVSISGHNVNWTVSGGTGDESTIAGYEVWAKASSSPNLVPLGFVATGVGTFDLSTASLTPGLAYSVYVEAVGIPCVVNQMSAGQAYTA